MHSRKSLPFYSNNIWIRKDGNPNFCVTMESYNGAVISELRSIYLTPWEKKYGEKKGLYHDDGLACFKNINGLSRINRKGLYFNI